VSPGRHLVPAEASRRAEDWLLRLLLGPEHQPQVPAGAADCGGYPGEGPSPADEGRRDTAVMSRLAANPCSHARAARPRSWCQALPPAAEFGGFGGSLRDAGHWERSGNVGMSITRQSQVVSSLTYLCVLAGD